MGDVVSLDDARKKKASIHDTGGSITTKYTMSEIERALHPRSREKVEQELEDIVNSFSDKHRDNATGSIKDADAAADEFMLMLAKYHFGSGFEAVKNDKKQIAKILQDAYGIKRDDIRSSFQRKGAYGTRKAIFEQHVNPLVEHVHSQKQQAAQESLNTYLSDAETRGQVESHLETRTGRKLNKGNYLTLQEAFNVIATYMQQPDADKIIGKKDAQVKLGDDTVGRPELYKIFDGGETFHKKYQDISNVIDAQHRFGGKKDDKKPEKRTGTYD